MILCNCHNVAFNEDIEERLKATTSENFFAVLHELQSEYNFGFTCGNCVWYLASEYCPEINIP